MFFVAINWFNKVFRVLPKCFRKKNAENEFLDKKTKDLVFPATTLLGFRG
jgi:5-methylcytosine-specific restriction endonuclease McrBC regulatory subunit McrC